MVQGEEVAIAAQDAVAGFGAGVLVGVLLEVDLAHLLECFRVDDPDVAKEVVGHVGLLRGQLLDVEGRCASGDVERLEVAHCLLGGVVGVAADLEFGVFAHACGQDEDVVVDHGDHAGKADLNGLRVIDRAREFRGQLDVR